MRFRRTGRTPPSAPALDDLNPLLFRRFVQLDRVAIRIVDQDLPAARPGLDRVAKMRMRPLECGDRGVEIIDVQHDAIPAARLLLRRRASGGHPTRLDC